MSVNEISNLKKNSYGKALLTIQRAALTVLTRGKKIDDMKYESSFNRL